MKDGRTVLGESAASHESMEGFLRLLSARSH